MPKSKKDITPTEKSYYKDDYPMIKCEACDSEGTVMQSLDGNEFPVPCPKCGGAGDVSSSPKIIIPSGFEIDAVPKIDRLAVIQECMAAAAKELQTDIDKQILESLNNYSLIDGVDELP